MFTCLQELFENYPVIFYAPNNPLIKSDVTGTFLYKFETRWTDPIGLFDKYEDSIRADSLGDTQGFRHSLAPLYAALDMERFFRESGRIQIVPDWSEYLRLLVHISTTSLQSGLGDALRIFSYIGRGLVRSSDEIKAQLSFALTIIGNECIIPSRANKWVALNSHPMIADDAQLEKLFNEQPEVVFIDCGEKLGIGDKRRLNKGD